MKYKLVTLEYTTDGRGTWIHLVGRGEDLSRDLTRIKPSLCRPYCFIQASDLDLCEEPFIESGLTTILGEPVVKIEFKYPYQVKEFKKKMLKRGVLTFESDIRFRDVFLKDSGMLSGYRKTSEGVEPVDAGEIPLRVMYLDLETYSSIEEKVDPKRASDPIISASLYDSYTKKFYLYYWHTRELDVDPRFNAYVSNFDNEASLLTGLAEGIARLDPDVITGWYLSSFDIPYLLSRMKKKGLDTATLSPLKLKSKLERSGGDRLEGRIYGRNIIGLERVYTLYKGKVSNLSLDATGKREGIGGKIALGKEVRKVWDIDPERVLAYNLRDVELLALLDSKLQLIRLLDYLRAVEVFGTRLDAALSAFKFGDMAFLKHARSIGIVLPDSNIAERERPYEGALVFDPEVGIHENIALIDFRSLYPSIIRAFNISADTFSLAGDIVVDEWHRFDSTTRGIVPSLLDRIKDLRREIDREAKAAREKGEKDRAEHLEQWSDLIKRRQNALYGTWGNKVFRLYSPRVAEAITLKGKQLLTLVKHIIEEQGYSVIYGDTDGLFVRIGSIDQAESLVETLNALLSREISEEVEVKLDLFFERLMLISKKRYMGKYIYYKGTYSTDFYQKGLETVRTDVSRIAQQVIETVGKMILDDKTAYLKDYLLEFKENYLSSKYPLEDIGIPTTLRKKLDTYIAKCQRCKRTITLDPEICEYRCVCGYRRRASSPIRALYYSNKYLKLGIEENETFYRVEVRHPLVDTLGFFSSSEIPEEIEGYPVKIDIQSMYSSVIRDLAPILKLVDPSLIDLLGIKVTARRGPRKQEPTSSLLPFL